MKASEIKEAFEHGINFGLCHDRKEDLWKDSNEDRYHHYLSVSCREDDHMYVDSLHMILDSTQTELILMKYVHYTVGSGIYHAKSVCEVTDPGRFLSIMAELRGE